MFIVFYYCLHVRVQPPSLAWAGLHDIKSLWALFLGPIVEFRLGYPISYLGTSKNFLSTEGLGTLGRLGLEGLLLFVYPNWFSSWSFTAWRAAKRFFIEFFGFLFENTCRCYLVFASLFPLLLAFNFCLLWLINGLE